MGVTEGLTSAGRPELIVAVICSGRGRRWATFGTLMGRRQPARLEAEGVARIGGKDGSSAAVVEMRMDWAEGRNLDRHDGGLAKLARLVELEAVAVVAAAPAAAGVVVAAAGVAAAEPVAVAAAVVDFDAVVG